MSSEDVCEVVITAPAGPWLPNFVRHLVEDRLCASGHVAPMHSTYRWKGAIHDTAEDRAALHTRTDLLPEIIERTLAEHPYDVPCVVAADWDLRCKRPWLTPWQRVSW